MRQVMFSVVTVVGLIQYANAQQQTTQPAYSPQPGLTTQQPAYPPRPAYPPQQPGYAQQPADAGTVGVPSSNEPNPDNCGTPDEPKACPPMPKRSLRHYPANRQ